MQPSTRRSVLAGTAALALAALTGPLMAADFDLEALIEAARAEPPINVYDSTSKIITMAEAFTAAYGVAATGVKVRAENQAEMVRREAQAGNVQGDVVILSDVPAGVLELIPEGHLESWLPPDLAAAIPEPFQDPLVVVNSAAVFAYNTEAAPEGCPIDNIWALTEPEWRGRVAMQDPLNRGELTDWFNQLATHADDAVAAAYETRYGKALAGEGDATTAWVEALAANGPLLTDSDQAISDAVGAPGQSESFIGIVSSAKFRDNAGKGYKLGLCGDVEPMIGFSQPKLALVATGTDSPNAARLFVHYVMTPEGIAPQMDDGKMSTNVNATLPADEPSGIGAVIDRVFAFKAATAGEDLDRRQDWQDVWRLHYTR